MFESINFTSANLITVVLAALFLITFAIFLVKRGINGRIGQKYKDTGNNSSYKLSTRNKYPEADVFKYRGNILLFSLAIVLGLLVSVFNWTTYEEVIEVEQIAIELEEDIEIEPPRSTAEPPPPPPPPPPVIEEIPNEVLLEADDVEFADQSVDESTEIDVPKPVIKEKKVGLPPPPPPPPPVEEEAEEIFKVVEEMPRFPGCEDMASSMKEKKACADKELYKFLYNNLVYPAMARENGIDGTVVVRFVVEKDGSINGTSVAREIGGGCGDEAVRVVKLMNEQGLKWSPGKQRGRAVRVMFTLPVRFKLANT